ncbi:hypothetical protein GGX14DRAFT_404828 [Mycena pura]|uniref:Uncharacterized protein n=1 Tax=Mycena pura TaxID=153505 RepID=A0AAD6UWR5_9AGAR|nr:hypothetical protein GGX14DRAFT_404828 [Mycena pura]
MIGLRRKPFPSDPENEPAPTSQTKEQVTTSAPGPQHADTGSLPDRYFREAAQLPMETLDGAADGNTAGRNCCQHWINEWTYIHKPKTCFGVFVSYRGQLCPPKTLCRVVRIWFVPRRLPAIPPVIYIPKNSFWNLWIMFAMPLAWIIWGLFYGVALLGAFIPAGLGYFGLIIKTVKEIEASSKSVANYVPLDQS